MENDKETPGDEEEGKEKRKKKKDGPLFSEMVQSGKMGPSAEGRSKRKKQGEKAAVSIKPTTERHHGTDKKGTRERQSKR